MVKVVPIHHRCNRGHHSPVGLSDHTEILHRCQVQTQPIYDLEWIFENFDTEPTLQNKSQLNP